MIIQTDVEDRIQMWSLKLNAKKISFSSNIFSLILQILYFKIIDNDNTAESTTKLNNNEVETFYSTADSTDLSAAKFCVNSVKVYDERLDFGDNARVFFKH